LPIQAQIKLFQIVKKLIITRALCRGRPLDCGGLHCIFTSCVSYYGAPEKQKARMFSRIIRALVA